MRHRRPHHSRAFSLVELLVVIGLIAVLVGLLLPMLSRSQRVARSLQCKSNLRQIGHELQIYANTSGGWYYPVGYDPYLGMFRADAFGAHLPPHERWPMRVFKIAAPSPLPYNPAAYTPDPYDPETFAAAPFTPAIMRCPTDPDAFEAHTYVVNGHIAEHRHRVGGSGLGGASASAVVLAGEKYTHERDYYMNSQDFDRLVDPYRHGVALRSNYLYLDGHVDNATPKEALNGLDPWDVTPATPVP